MSAQPQTSLRRSRSRSRSRTGGTGVVEDGLTDLQQAQIIEAALPPETRSRLQKLCKEGVMYEGAFDAKSLSRLHALTLPLQERVLSFLDREKVFLMNSRSKSGFLMAACDKARLGALDERGIGAPDPWRQYLLRMATPKRPQIDLVPEKKWLQDMGSEPMNIRVDVTADSEIGVDNITLAMSLNHPIGVLKRRLVDVGIGFPPHKIRLCEVTLGFFLKDDKSLAFYNLRSGSELRLSCNKRGGRRFRKDNSVLPIVARAVPHLSG
eukprot:TRINITY_DN62257_c0_g1_i1.p1 TRINITY_DN62257_c0_g1~~TRINITY_DN62257_c0_g1_i1.p1  ORF type:complete len:292 (-),score=51.07 TRINITY_DN62257_c0_g1_i1:82-879(-)